MTKATASLLGGSQVAHPAPAGTTQATATTVVGDDSLFASVSVSGAGAILQGMNPGDTGCVVNGDSSNDMNVYPPVGAAFNGGTVNLPFMLAPNSAMIYRCVDAKNFAAVASR